MSKWLRRSRSRVTESSTASSLSDDVEAFIKPSGPPILSNLFSDAAKFHKVLTASDCIKLHRSSSQSSQRSPRDSFADLVGRDLDCSEKAAAGNVARLHAAQYPWGSNLSTEPDFYDQSKTPEDSEEEGELLAAAADSDEGYPDKLEPTQVVDVLIEEFGPLASDDVTETLVLEADGFMIYQDVFIMV